MNDNIEIRKIQAQDNEVIAEIIKSVLVEFNNAMEGTAYYDKETNAMYEAYLDEKTIYYVALLNDEIIAGCGISGLKGGEATTCELQKMYMKPKARGKKIGAQLVSKCLEFAKRAGYTQCYLESFPNMEAAIGLYHKYGFVTLEKALGNTSHYSCNVWMLKQL